MDTIRRRTEQELRAHEDARLKRLQKSTPSITLLQILEIEQTHEYNVLMQNDKKTMGKTLIDGLTRLLVMNLKDYIPENVVREFVKHQLEGDEDVY